MYHYEYPRPMVTVDMVVLRKEKSEVLLIERGNDPFRGEWALPGGFIEMNEKLEESAIRELQEETGITGIALKQLKTYGEPGRDPRGRTISVIFGGQAIEGEQAIAGDDAAKAEWFSIHGLPKLAFDHSLILEECLPLI